MSYKYYSEDAVKEIMLKIRESRQNGSDSVSSKSHTLTADNFADFEKELNPDSEQTRNVISEYDHPSTSINSGFEKTHILLDRIFHTDLPKDDIWRKILDNLIQNFNNETSVEVKNEPSRKKWVHLSHSNFETVVTLTKKERNARLKISQRVGFWSAKIEGLLHGAYISLLLFGLIFATVQPSFAQSVGILLTVWAVSGLVVYGFSKSSRKRKRRHLNKLANHITERLTK